MENIVHLKEPVIHEFDYDEEIAGSLKSIDLNDILKKQFYDL